ncbi:MAG: hypothetical protein DCC49_13860 [Acidobacteria bacterium]|nr:MAG: hypothetical protein DCC49_13860 [Acidobacteriota bacterium]
MSEAMASTEYLVQPDEVSRPDPEVPERPRRRRFSAEYKLAILEEIDAAAPEERAAIIRREGIYSRYISKWRAQQKAGSLRALGAKRGPKPDPVATENAKLRKQNKKLRKDLEAAHLVIEVQKKVSRLLQGPDSEAS